MASDSVKIDSRYLEGLMWNDVKTSVSKEKDKDGKREVLYDKVSRKLLSSDVLSCKEYEDEVVFVTSDGKKYNKSKLSKSGG